MSKNGLWINGIAVELAQPMEFRLSRGIDPWQVAIPVSDSRFNQLQNPLTIRFKIRDKTYEWENWHVTSRVVSSELKDDLIIQDDRWRAQYKKLTKGYNIKWFGDFDEDQWRMGTRNPVTNAPWKVTEAIEDACIEFGLNFIDNPELPSEINDIELPINFGNVESGGFFGASISEVLPKMLEVINCDLAITKKGQVYIADRLRQASDALIGEPVIGGVAGPRSQEWSRPENIIVLFERQMERKFYFDEENRQTVSGPRNTDLELENVIPKLPDEVIQIADRIPKNAADNRGNILAILAQTDLDDIQFEDFYDTVLGATGMTRSEVLKHVLKPSIFDVTVRTTAVQYFIENYYDTQMKTHFRSTYRVRKIKINNEAVIQPYSNIRLGRIANDGTITNEGMVSMDYVRVNRFANYPPGKFPGQGAGSFDAEFSDNFRYEPDRAAPFRASWLSPTKDGDLMISVSPEPPHKALDRHYIAGKLVNELRYGDAQDIAQGDPIEVVESTLELDEKFRMSIWYVGKLITSVDGVDREYRVTVPTTTGNINTGPDLYVRVSDLTANYKFDGTWPGELLNDADLQERAERVAQQIIDTYEGKRWGSLVYDGMDVLDTKVPGADGDIQDVVVRVGYETAADIKTIILVQPGGRRVQLSTPDLSGLAPSEIS